MIYSRHSRAFRRETRLSLPAEDSEEREGSARRPLAWRVGIMRDALKDPAAASLTASRRVVVQFLWAVALVCSRGSKNVAINLEQLQSDIQNVINTWNI